MDRVRECIPDQSEKAGVLESLVSELENMSPEDVLSCQDAVADLIKALVQKWKLLLAERTLQAVSPKGVRVQKVCNTMCRTP